MMVVPLGLSFGDIVITVQLLAKAIKVLKSSTRATREYLSAIALLEMLQAVFTKLDDLKLPNSILAISALQATVQVCHEEVQRFFAKLEKYGNTFVSHIPRAEKPHHPLKTAQSKLSWALSGKKDFEEFATQISPHINVINTYLQLCEQRHREELQTKVDWLIVSQKSMAMVRGLDLESLVDQRKSRLLVAGTLSGSVPSSPTMLLDDNFQFLDAHGQNISLPYDHFRYFSVFKARLECAFRNRLGHQKVLQGMFQLFNVQRNPGR